jgi:hypothetical protein
MMFDWSGHRQELMETIGKIARLSPETVRGYTKRERRRTTSTQKLGN